MNLAPGFRVAVYYAPDRIDPLWTAGCQWLGRDPESGAAFQPPEAVTAPDLIKDPSGYGFHGTLKPPMRLAEGLTYAAFVDSVQTLARGLKPFAMPRLSVQNLHGFIAVRDAEPSPDLQALADIVVAQLDDWRAMPSEAELAKRRKAGLSAAQEAMLTRWGYPYVFQLWQFHLTLSRRLDETEMTRLLPAAEAFFAPALAHKRVCNSLAVYIQPESGAPFTLSARIPFEG
ncbi:DUF1045 domain-containing protein [Acidisoma cellulosilytica]|uniref:DUF1045 domain-containing protein n=1 Tax=Acidisoma cellulosilyticum TaxID=2802395 RepID=A0A963Z0N7_9PROT|nr:DUF1045 domain-containing protein [Acidisoma cellulosilyticum]MCB8880391.1 DUF1045 domain-containing protein [Acidisoma cellulosilyticum]